MQKERPDVPLQRSGVALQRTGGELEKTGGARDMTGGTLQRTGGARDRAGGTLQTGVALQRTAVALQRTCGAVDTTGVALMRTGVALKRSGFALQRTGGAPERTDGAKDSAGGTLQRTGGALDRTGVALQRTAVALQRKISIGCFALASQIHNTNAIAKFFHVFSFHFMTFSLFGHQFKFFLSKRVACQSAPARFYSTKLTAFIQYPSFSLTCWHLPVFCLFDLRIIERLHEQRANNCCLGRVNFGLRSAYVIWYVFYKLILSTCLLNNCRPTT